MYPRALLLFLSFSPSVCLTVHLTAPPSPPPPRHNLKLGFSGELRKQEKAKSFDVELNIWLETHR